MHAQERYWFCNAPASLRDPRNAAALLHFAMRYAAKEPVALHVAVPEDKPTTAEELQHMENLHQVIAQHTCSALPQLRHMFVASYVVVGRPRMTNAKSAIAAAP